MIKRYCTGLGVPNSSETVLNYEGTASVSEASAITCFTRKFGNSKTEVSPGFDGSNS